MDGIDKLTPSIGITLDRFIKQRQDEFPFATGELSQLLRDIALAGKIIHREVNRAGLIDIIGSFGQQNIQGEEQQKLDVVADVRFIRALRNGGEVCAIASEEDECFIDTGNHHAKYVATIDPLDGSSNIDVNVSIGTIFSIYRRVSPVGSPPTLDDFLQPGHQQVAAGYIIYGSSTMLVYTTGRGVNGFTYEQSIGEFILSHPNIRIPGKGKIYSCNDGNWLEYPEAIQQFIGHCRQQRLTARYIGSLVADFHRNLLKGGIFLYPASHKAPQGKLRLLFEANPMAFIMEQAGGAASNGHQRILDCIPSSLHERTPLFVGSKDLMDTLQSYMAQTATMP